MSDKSISGKPIAVPTDGPFYDDLKPGMELEPQAAVTIDAGLTAYYQSIVGEVLPLTLDHRLSSAVTGRQTPLASPGLVLNLAIGQSTVVTRRAIANLFYSNVRILRPVHVGETLHTSITILDMADASAKPNRPNRGKVLIGMKTVADDELVIDCQRCALLPLRENVDLPGHSGDTGQAPGAVELDQYLELLPESWQTEALPEFGLWTVGEVRADITREVIDQATGLVRLTHNRAIVHRDIEASSYPSRLVYGGHVQALAQASLTRLEPRHGTFLAWHACNHIGPAFEGDLLSFEHVLLQELQAANGMVLRAYETTGWANRDGDKSEIIRWIAIGVGR